METIGLVFVLLDIGDLLIAAMNVLVVQKTHVMAMVFAQKVLLETVLVHAIVDGQNPIANMQFVLENQAQIQQCVLEREHA